MYIAAKQIWGLSFYLHASTATPSRKTTILFANAMNEWNTDLYQKKHSFVYEYGTSLVEMARPRRGETILDIGCGTGELTYQLYNLAVSGAAAATSTISNEIEPLSSSANPTPNDICNEAVDESDSNPTIVIGIDADQNMIQKANELYPNIDHNKVKFITCDARTMLSNDEIRFGSNKNDSNTTAVQKYYDLVFSNAALHWIPQKDMETVVQHISQLLKPNGGRLVIEFGGKGNIDSIITACQDILRDLYDVRDIVSPWYFPSISEFTTLLEQHNIEVISAELYDRPTKLVDPINGMKDWIQMFGQSFIDQAIRSLSRSCSSSSNNSTGSDDSLSPIDIVEQQELFLTAVNERLKSSTLYDGYQWIADYRRIRIVAYKR